MVVAMEPAVKGSGSSCLAAVGPDVSPLLQEGPVEPLDLSIGLGSVGPAVAMENPCLLEGLVEEDPPVGAGVVGHHPLDDDPVGPVERLRPAPEGGGGGTGLIGQDLGVGQAGTVVDG